MPIPPKSEKQAILKQIDQSLATVEKTKNRLATEISLIEEYRTRLVADVVTGQLDVRNVELPQIEEDLGEIVDDSADDELEDSDEILEEVEV